MEKVKPALILKEIERFRYQIHENRELQARKTACTNAQKREKTNSVYLEVM